MSANVSYLADSEQVLATATFSLFRTKAKNLILKASQSIDQPAVSRNLYGYNLNKGVNICLFTGFALLFLFHVIISTRSRYYWFNFCFVFGYGFECFEYLIRILSFDDTSRFDLIVMQNLFAAIAPLFILAGIHFVFTQIVVIHGRQYTILKPLWYVYVFITMYVVLLIFQAVGGSLVCVKDKTRNYVNIGASIMFSGLIIQIVTMGAFFFFLLNFLCRSFFLDRSKVLNEHQLRNKNVLNFLKMLLNVKSARTYKQQELDRFYNPRYQGIRSRPLFSFYPLVIFVTVLAILVRSIYKSVQTKMGWSGALMKHEVFFFIFDSAVMAICGVTFTLFHPLFVFGKENVLSFIHVSQEDGFVDTEEEKILGKKETLTMPQTYSNRIIQTKSLYMF